MSSDTLAPAPRSGFSPAQYAICLNGIVWRETYFSKDETVDASVHRNVSTITTRDRTTGKVDSKTFIGRTPLLPSDFDRSK